ncbi:UNVERIFIED_CONTAM: hypothetical protein HDU68_004100 [Siphonaria sp. JEL0065]|nr:hypothetical protein HDU68_004100 [Siphonaria sp. JEL0065]
MLAAFSLLILSSTASAAAAALAPNAAITDVVAFGDSLTDNGNLFKKYGLPPAPYWNGRFSTGPVWVEYLSQYLNNATLHNYAFGGSVSNIANADNSSVAGSSTVFANMIPDFPSQIEVYKTDAAIPLDTTLFTIFIGGNDFNYAVNAGKVPNPVAVATNVLNGVQRLITLGAKNILVTAMTPLYLMPSFNGNAALVPKIKALVDGYNGILFAGISKLQTAVPSGVNIIVNDQTKLLTYIATPQGSSEFKFPNTTGACFQRKANPPTVCAVSTDYFFFDNIHPTTRGQNFMAQYAYNQIYNISGFLAPEDVVNPPLKPTTADTKATYVAPSPTSQTVYVAPLKTQLYSGAVVCLESGILAMIVGLALLI